MRTIIVHCYIHKIVRFPKSKVSIAGRFGDEEGPEYCLRARLSICCSGRFFDCLASNIPPSLSPLRSFSLISFCGVGQSSLRTPSFVFLVVSCLPHEGSTHCFGGIFVVESSSQYTTMRSRFIRNPLLHCWV